MQEDRYPLITTLGETPFGRLDAVIEEEILAVVDSNYCRVKPAGGIEPEDSFVAVRTEAVDDVLSDVFQFTSERAHDENRYGGRNKVGNVHLKAGSLALDSRRVFRVRKVAYRFDEGDVGVFEAFGKIPSGLVVVRGIEIK